MHEINLFFLLFTSDLFIHLFKTYTKVKGTSNGPNTRETHLELQ